MQTLAWTQNYFVFETISHTPIVSNFVSRLLYCHMYFCYHNSKGTVKHKHFGKRPNFRFLGFLLEENFMQVKLPATLNNLQNYHRKQYVFICTFVYTLHPRNMIDFTTMPSKDQ